MTLCVVISGPTLAQARSQIEDAAKSTNLVEWRLDLFENQALKPLRELKQQYAVKTIFTLRPESQGGKWQATEDVRLAKLAELASLNPDYLDLEHTVPESFVRDIKQKYPNIKIILSHHDFEKTPKELQACLEQLQTQKCDYYKIACTANSALDTYSMLVFAKTAPNNCMLMTMGATGPLSRILAPVVGRPITYVSAQGQISARELLETYGYNALTQSTAIYGLIGDPVDKSVSHKSHNEVMRAFGLSSVYVKTVVKSHELGEFLQLAKKIGMKGLSVTIPLKEEVMQYCDAITPDAKKVGAVNTLHFCDGKIIGSNTDAPGILEAIEAHTEVAGKQVIIIGAGGAAKAIAWQLVQKGAQVLVVNRNKDRAKALAAHIGCKAGSLDEVGTNYSIIINATAVDSPIDPQYIIPGCIAIDIHTIPKETLFLQHAHKKGCKLIYGYEMFINQALLQFKTWFPSLDSTQVKQVLTKSVLSQLLQEAYPSNN